MTPLRLPAKSPKLNAHAERFVRSIRNECLDHLIPLGERHLRSVVREYAAHYHRERNHQGLGNEIIAPSPGLHAAKGRIVRHRRLRGLLNYYQREAA